MWMPVLNVLCEITLEIEGTFRRQRIKTKPKGHNLLGGEKFIHDPAQCIDVFHRFNAADFIDLVLGETPACPDLTLKIRLEHKQALTDQALLLLDQQR